MPNTPIENVDLRVNLNGLELRNPILLASGILGTTSDLLHSAYESGAGAVVTKSIGLTPREGYENPTVFQYSYGLLNAMGLPNMGIDGFRREMKGIEDSNIAVIGSIFAANPEDFSRLARDMKDLGVVAIELNLSCPHAEGFGAEVGADPSEVRGIASAVASAVKIPVFAKLTPNTSDIVALGRAAQEGGANAVVAINSVKAMAIDPFVRKPVLANTIGGLSGKAIKPIGIRCVFELFESLDIPIIGVGGITSGLDAAEYIMAGASAVQIGSAIEYSGLDAFSTIRNELKEFMQKEGFRNLSEMRGIAHE